MDDREFEETLASVKRDINYVKQPQELRKPSEKTQSRSAQGRPQTHRNASS